MYLAEAIVIFRVFFATFQSFIECSSYFHALSADTRQAFVENNCATAGTLNSLFIIHERKALDNMIFKANCIRIYGDKAMKYSDYLTPRLEPNGILIKVMILILAFSTNTSIDNPDHSRNIMTLSSTLSAFHMQSIHCDNVLEIFKLSI
ncbi:unnamed protein product [Rotaria sordida]|uniref:Uncharacterized protein n=1 Tax=Rotaria sordida TaxID=392033 RepID=A0A818SBX6_9BILA|nr:unnamed protein product [Rotaria sordida]CAF3667319.1 unnamed protein product [Rotaria sordida]